MTGAKELLASVDANNVFLGVGATAGFLTGLFAAGKVKSFLFGSHMSGEQAILTTATSLSGCAIPHFFMDGANPSLVGFVYGLSLGSAVRCAISGMAHPRY